MNSTSIIALALGVAGVVGIGVVMAWDMQEQEKAKQLEESFQNQPTYKGEVMEDFVRSTSKISGDDFYGKRIQICNEIYMSNPSGRQACLDGVYKEIQPPGVAPSYCASFPSGSLQYYQSGCP